VYKCSKFHKNIANESPLRYKFLAKIEILPVLGAVFPHFCPDKREISHLSGQRVAPVGEKPIFGPLSKNNIGMAVLRACLPIINAN